MKKFLLVLCAMCLLPMGAYAKIVARANGPEGSLLLQDDKCDDGVGYKLMAVDLRAKSLHFGCWIQNQGVVYVISPTLGSAAIPAEVFDWKMNSNT